MSTTATAESLFDTCVNALLKFPSLHGKAVTYLPQRIAHYLLYRACRAGSSHSLLAVQNLVAAWHHKELSFDFASNPICRRKQEGSGVCLRASEYYGEFTVELQYESCASSILIGIFQNVLNHVERGVSPTLGVVDMRAIKLGSSPGAALWKLARGEFPGRHASDYISHRDTSKFGHVCHRPLIPPNSSDHLICIYVDLIIDSLLSLEACSEAILHPSWFQIVVKGIRPTELDTRRISEAVHTPGCSKVDTLLLNGCGSFVGVQSYVSLCKQLQPSNLLLVGCCRVSPLLGVLNQLNSLVLESSAFYELAQVQCQVKAFTAITDVSSNRHQLLAKCLFNLREGLHYLSLQRSRLTDLPLDSISHCQHLRVISVLSPLDDGGPVFSHIVQTASDVFKALSHLRQLEYFEWSETINLRTVDLLSLHTLLLDSLPHLNHWHLGLSFLLLSTTDLEQETFAPLSPLLLTLLSDRVGDDSCTTFRFGLENEEISRWLNSLRPSVCFKIAKPQTFRKKCIQTTYLY